MAQLLLSMKDFESSAIRPGSSYLDIFVQVASVLRNKKVKQDMEEKSSHFKTRMAGIGFKEPISMKIGGSKRKGLDNSDDDERGCQFKKQKMDMDSILETKESSLSVREDLKVETLYSVGTIKTENCIIRCDTKKKSSLSDDDKEWGLRPKPKNLKLKMRKPTIFSIDATSLPEEYKRKIENFDQAKATLVIQKELTKTDLSLSASRLSIPINQIKPERFLNEEERKFLAEQNEWPVSVIDPLLEEKNLTLRQWNMPKITGKTSSSYVLRTGWNEVADKNSLLPKDVVQVWSFRDVGNNLHFAIVLVKKGGEHNNSRGHTQPCRRDIGQGTETKEEVIMVSDNNDESLSGRSTISTGYYVDHMKVQARFKSMRTRKRSSIYSQAL